MDIQASKQLKTSKQHLSIKKYDFSILDDKQKSYLNHWGPPSLVKSSIVFFIGAVYLITIGVICFISNKDIEEKSYQYGHKCNDLNQICTIEFEIKKTIKKPVYIYYEMHQFNQNHKLYLDSFSEGQLMGEINNNDLNSICSPYVTNRDMNKTVSANGKQLDPDATAIPCGIRAQFYFEDTFKLYQQDSEQQNQHIQINEKNIAWEYDRNRYKNTNLDKQWIDIEDEHFLVWVRPSPLSKFRKLWGSIDQDIQSGKYIMEIENKFNQTYFESEKHFVLANQSKIGGENQTLIVSHFVSGIVFIVIGVGLVIFNSRQNKKIEEKSN